MPLWLGCYPAIPQALVFNVKATKMLKAEGNNRDVGTVGNMGQASTAVSQEIVEWVKKDKRRMLHVVYRVGDLDRTIKYVHSVQYALLHRSCVGICDE